MASTDSKSRRRATRPLVTQRGAALIAVAVALSMAGLIVTEFSTSTNIDMFAAENAENDMKAHFLARSGMNLSKLVIHLQTDVLDQYRQFLGDIQISDYVGLFVGAFGGSKDELEGLSALVGGFDMDNAKGLGVPPGSSFDVNITTEDGKINVNCAKDGVTQDALNNPTTPGDFLLVQLASLIYSDGYNPIFENEDAEGYRRDRETQVTAIIDYIDRDSSRAMTPGAPEDYGYENLDDDYLPKNYPVDSLDELKLIRGVDDRFWTLFGGQFTVYGRCKINIGAVAHAQTIANLIRLAAKDPNDPVINDPVKLGALARRVTEARTYGVYFNDVNAFVEFVKNPDGVFQQQQQSNPTTTTTVDPTTLVPVEGVELDTNKLNQVVTSGPRETFRVEVIATVKVGERALQKRIVGIWDKKWVNQNNRDPNDRNGTWMFWRED